MKKIKCIFISHALLTNNTGAATSLRTFLKYQSFLDIDLVLPLFIFNLFRWPKLIRQNLRSLPPSVNKVYFFPLPWSRCFEGSQTSPKAVAAYALSNIVAYIFRPILKFLLKQPTYKFIYLNSVALHSLTSAHYKTIVHVREVLKKPSDIRANAIDNLKKAAGLIFIDKRTHDAFSNHIKNDVHPSDCIINNPFDMTKARRLREKKIPFKYTSHYRCENEKIFSYVGSIEKIKGVDFIIKTFLHVKPMQAKLLIIGSGTARYFNYCKTLAADSQSIVFLGELGPDAILEIYAQSDYVLRGDPDFRIGRTIYEGLYAGCRVILPKSPADNRIDADLSPFSGQVLFYKPRDINSLGEIFQEAAATKQENNYNGPSGNIGAHCREIKNFLEKILAH